MAHDLRYSLGSALGKAMRPLVERTDDTLDAIKRDTLNSIGRSGETALKVVDSMVEGYNEMKLHKKVTEKLDESLLRKTGKLIGIGAGAVTSAKMLTWIPTIISWLSSGVSSYGQFLFNLTFGSNPITIIILTMILLVGKYDIMRIRTELMKPKTYDAIKTMVHSALARLGLVQPMGFDTAFDEAVRQLQAREVGILFGDAEKSSSDIAALAKTYKDLDAKKFWANIAPSKLVGRSGSITLEDLGEIEMDGAIEGSQGSVSVWGGPGLGSQLDDPFVGRETTYGWMEPSRSRSKSKERRYGVGTTRRSRSKSKSPKTRRRSRSRSPARRVSPKDALNATRRSRSRSRSPKTQKRTKTATRRSTRSRRR